MGDLVDRNNDVSIHKSGEPNTPIHVAQDPSGLWRLYVEAFIDPDSAFNLQAFAPKVDFDSTGINLNVSTWDTLLNVTGVRGKLDFIATVGASSLYKVRLTVDGTEVFDIAMADLSAIGLSNAANVEMWAETADKNFRYRPNVPVDFTDSLKVEVIATSATPLLKHLIMYREEA